MADLMTTAGATAAAAAALLALLVLAARRGDLLQALGTADPVGLDDGSTEQGQGGAGLDVAAALAPFDISAYMQPDPLPQAEPGANVSAFLWTIRRAEGTAGPDGYRTLFGGSKFTGWADHPRQPQRFGAVWTTAAGAYQFMAVSALPTGGTTKVNTWDRIRDRLGLPDFSPASQDAAAVELIREAGALGDVEAGRFDAAVAKVRRIWASLPGAGYGQPERSLSDLRTAYAQAGGTLA